MRGAHVKVVTVETETDLNMSCHPAILVQERSKEFRRLWDEMDTIPMTHHFRRFLNCGLKTGDDMS